MNQHTYYQPNEYEQMFIAAGFISAADLDSDYQEYLSKTKGDEFQMGYQSWQAQKRRWDALNEQYEREIEPLFPDEMTPEKERLSEKLLKEMSYCEQALGY